ncbi:hypothetical protein SAMN05428939_5332 [Streptomyces sp. TLI_105]|nr:hypothetical protein SAMN05428939_5332 [Streptomyces sp. TLI_105]
MDVSLSARVTHQIAHDEKVDQGMGSITGFRKRAAAALGATALIVAGGVATAGRAAAGPH